MAGLPSPADDFVPEDAISSGSQKARIPLLVWILGGLGCGCSSLVFLSLFSIILLPLLLTRWAEGDPRETEARRNVQTLIRAQQAYFLENSQFTGNVQDLGLGMQLESKDYEYALFANETPFQVFIRATPKHKAVRGYTGAVFLHGEALGYEYYSGLCQAEAFGASSPNPALDIDMEPPEVVCPSGSTKVE